MNDLLKWAGKLAIQAIFWIFLLSIKYHGRPFFYYANDTLVQNSMVQTIDESLADCPVQQKSPSQKLRLKRHSLSDRLWL